ncbi:MAG: alpha/beta hydrolase [Pseudomonadota bacterium]
MSWNLDQTFETQAGTVAAGSFGSGPPLVLAHGWPWSSFSWHRVIPALAVSHTVYWYDMPGYGQSEMSPAQATSLDVQGGVFSEMLDHWRLEHPKVIAHDVGGAIALRAHLLGQVEFEKLVLMNVVAVRPWGSEFFEHVGKHIEAFLGLPPHIHKAVVDAYIRGALVSSLEDDDLDALVAPWITDPGRVSFYRQFEQADERYTAEIEGDFGKLRCPTTLFWGENDPWIPLSRGLELKDKIKPERFEVLSGLGHLPQLEDATLVAEKLQNALRV